jgi:deoxyadenosine kinase
VLGDVVVGHHAPSDRNHWRRREDYNRRRSHPPRSASAADVRAGWQARRVQLEPSPPSTHVLRKPRQADAFGNIFIGIAGMIGAGKSTLATALGKHLGIDCYYEPVADNEYLADFYRDTARYSFAMQVYLLNRRFQQHQEIIWRGRSAVQDRTIYEDSIFAKMLAETGLMDRRDYETYVQLFRNMSNFMCKPNVIVYLDVSPEASAARIESRSREVESGISLDYLRALHAGYQEFVATISKVIPVIRVDYERFASTEAMAEVIEREYLDASFLRQVTRFDPAR